MISKKLSIVHCQLSIILAFLPLSVAYAQQDSTLNRTVVVENEYNPNIMDASKINVLPKVEEPAVMKKGIEYATALRPVLAWTYESMSPITREWAMNRAKRGYVRAGFFKKSIEHSCLHYKSYPCNQRHTQRINQPFRNHRTQRFGKRCTIIFSQHPATGNLTYTGNNQVGGIRHKDGIHTIGCFGMLAQRSQRKLPPPATKNMTKHAKH